MRKNSFSLSAIVLSSALSFLPSCSGPIRNIGKYELDYNAGCIAKNYAGMMYGNLNDAAEHILELADKNGDNKIDPDEVYDAINLIRPIFKEFHDKIMSLKKDPSIQESSAENKRD